MIKIKCVNPNCPSPDHKFDWDEAPYEKKGLEILPDEKDSTDSMIIDCPYCDMQNKIFIRNLEQDSKVYRLS